MRVSDVELKTVLFLEMRGKDERDRLQGCGHISSCAVKEELGDFGAIEGVWIVTMGRGMQDECKHYELN